MISYKFSWAVLHFWFLSLLLFKAHGQGLGFSVNFKKAPNSTSSQKSGKFLFDVSGFSGCRCNITCKLDGNPTDCGGQQANPAGLQANYAGLQDGNHTFEVCDVGSVGDSCFFYNWTVDTVPPTAYIISPSSLTSGMNIVSINISFTEPCIGEDGKDGFKCSSENVCNLLVRGDAQVIPSSLVTLVPTREYTLLVALSPKVQHGIVIFEMDDNFCNDAAGNTFIKAQNSTFSISYDRRYALAKATSTIVTSTFGITCLAQGMLALSSASLVSSRAISGVSSPLMSDPASNLFLSLGHIQLIALSRWLPVKLPVNYYKYAKALEWSIPYFNLPWEKEHVPRADVKVSSERRARDEICHRNKSKVVNSQKAANTVQSGWSSLSNGNGGSSVMSETTKTARSFYSECQESDGWRDFKRSMFWLSVIGGSAILLHALLIIIIKIKWPHHIHGDYGVLTFPRFEIFCIILALPCICKASAGLIKDAKGPGDIVGGVLLGVVGLILLFFFIVLLVGVTLGMLFLYDGDYEEQEAQKQKWIQRFRRSTLGPLLRGEWKWTDQSKRGYLIILGPLFEELRGLPRDMLPGNSHNHGGKETGGARGTGGNPHNKYGDFKENVFGRLRTYYILLESMKQVILGILAGAYMPDDYVDTDESSKSPEIVMLSFTCFLLFFLVYLKPFISKRSLLVEIISVVCEVGVFTLTLLLFGKGLSHKEKVKIDNSMVILPFMGYAAGMINQFYSLYKQIQSLDQAHNSFLGGLRIAFSGFFIFFLPQKLMENWQDKSPQNKCGESVSSADRKGAQPRQMNQG